MNEVTKDRLASDFKVLINDVQGLLKATSSEAGGSIADLRQRLGKKLEEGRKTLSEQEKVWRDKAQTAKVSAEAYLKEKPWTALGIAAGIGLVLGSLLGYGNGKRSQ